MIFSVKSVKIRIIRGKITRLAVFYFPFQVQDEILGSPEPLTPDSVPFEAGLESMTIMQLLLHIEVHF